MQLAQRSASSPTGTSQLAEPLLSIRDVSVRYEQGAPAILSEIDFSLCEGETVLLMGPSGCGKSTLAMLCAKLIPQSVEAVVEGQVEFSAALQASGDVGYVFQDPDAQFCMLQVADEVAFGLENRQVPRAQMPDRIASALEQAGSLVPWTAQHALFSGGMKQKLAIASALAQKPTLLILDEPTANLDPLSTRQVFDQIAALRAAGQTMIVIEHKFDALLPIMDRVVLFDHTGRIYREGPTLDVVREEWDWLVQEGVVAQWKQPPECAGDDRILKQSGHSAIPLDPQDSSGPLSPTVPALSLAAAQIAYGDRIILSDLTLTIAKGDFVAIVGPNGAGKSSLLQLFAGLTKARTGSVHLLGRPIREWKPRARFGVIAYSFQNPEFQFIYERVGDELANRIVGEQVPERVQALLNQFGLEGLEQHSPFALSQGQKRRLSVASMLRDEHDMYLFDEPTFGQDARTQLALLEQMRQLHEQGKTIILTTHDMDLVRRYAKRVLVVAEGGVLFSGTPEALFAREDIQVRAHLRDDQLRLDSSDVGLPTSAYRDRQRSAQNLSSSPIDQADERASKRDRARRKSPVQRLNPAWMFASMLAAAVISLSAHTLPQALAQFALPLFVMMALGWMSPWRILKLLAPFVILYILYFWTYVANSAIPPGAPSYHVLFYTISWVGVHNGLVLSIRMLGSVLFGILFVTQIDITEFMVALTRSFKVPPRFAYGALAGLRVVPLFSSEWTKLRQARQIRSRESAAPVLRVITYALPLLSQGIRMSERVAIAMEARGFVGPPAMSAQHRTFYREVNVHWWDYVVSLSIVALSLLGIVLIH